MTDVATDALLDHEWVERYRIPLVPTFSQWAYLVALIVPSAHHDEDDPIRTWGPVWPTDDEAALIGRFIDYERAAYTGPTLSWMQARPVDLYVSASTLYLIRTRDGWHCTRQPPAFKPTPMDPPYKPDAEGLLALLDNEAGGERWVTWDMSNRSPA